MNDITEEIEQNDAQTIAAIRNGELDRYGELIARYERKVFAVAWSRLGDMDLAEEATQEAFIKGYRHLSLLKSSGRFATWITAIARNAAINLGLRRRHELEKRERWSLGQVDLVERERASEEKFSGESLRDGLAKLTPLHRESLVLFYLEGKSVTEGAAALGISETAFKTRLHRARVAMREHLERQLEDSLSELRPARAIAPLVMTVLGATSAQAVTFAGGAAAATKLSAGLLKFIPFPFIMTGIWIIGAIPGLLLGYWMGQLEKRNYKDQKGFRARLYQSLLMRTMILVPIFMAGFFALAQWGQSHGEGKGYYQFLGVICVAVLAGSIRNLALNRSRFVVGRFAGIAALGIGFLVVGFTGVPVTIVPIFLIVFILVMSMTFQQKPLRLDYNLFLRTALGMMKGEGSAGENSKMAASQEDLFRFGRFLGEHWLVNDYRRTKTSLRFRLPPVRAKAMQGPIPLIWGGSSILEVGMDGSVSISMGRKDAVDLRKLGGSKSGEGRELERTAAQWVQSAWNDFRGGRIDAAEEKLGEQSEESIFHEPPSKSKGQRWGRRVLIALVIFQIVLLAVLYLISRGSFQPPQPPLVPAMQREPVMPAPLL